MMDELELTCEERREIIRRMKPAKKTLAGKIPNVEKNFGLLNLSSEVVKILIDTLSRRYFSKEQAAAFTSLSAETLDKYVERGKLTAHYAGSRVFYTRDDLVRFMEACPTDYRSRKVPGVGRPPKKRVTA
jgi:hypothetical protein